MNDNKKGILYGLVPVAGLLALGLAWWLIGKTAAILCTAFYAGGWASHKHRSYVRSLTATGKLYAVEKIKAWRQA